MFVPENLVSRDGFGSPVLRQPAHLHTRAEYGAYLWNSFRVPRRRPFFFHFFYFFRTLARSLEPVVTECKEHTIRTQTKTNG